MKVFLKENWWWMAMILIVIFTIYICSPGMSEKEMVKKIEFCESIGKYPSYQTNASKGVAWIECQDL